MLALAPLFGGLEGFGSALIVLVIGAFGFLLLLSFLFWFTMGLLFRERLASKLLRAPRIPPLEPAPPERRTLQEWTDAIHLHAVAWLRMDKLVPRNATVRQELQRIITQVVEANMATAASPSQRQAVAKVVVGRLLGEIGEHGTQWSSE